MFLMLIQQIANTSGQYKGNVLNQRLNLCKILQKEVNDLSKYFMCLNTESETYSFEKPKLLKN